MPINSRVIELQYNPKTAYHTTQLLNDRMPKHVGKEKRQHSYMYVFT